MTRFVKVIAVAGILIAAACGASAQLLLLGVGPGGSNGSPPSCSNALDFTDPCNSQYLGAL